MIITNIVQCLCFNFTIFLLSISFRSPVAGITINISI